MNGSGVIEEIIHKEGGRGWFYKLKIDNRNYNVFEKDYNTQETVKAFAQLEAKEFEGGEAVTFEYSEHTKDGTTYKNLLTLSKLGEEEAAKVVQKTNDSKDKTGTQIVRMNALTNAIGFFELNKEVVAMNLKEGESLNQSISEDMVTKLAELFEKWVKR